MAPLKLVIQGQVTGRVFSVTPLETDKNDYLTLAPLSHNVLNISSLLVVNHSFSLNTGWGDGGSGFSI